MLGLPIAAPLVLVRITPPVLYWRPIQTFGPSFRSGPATGFVCRLTAVVPKGNPQVPQVFLKTSVLIPTTPSSSVSVQRVQSTSQGGRYRTPPTLNVDLLQNESLLHQPGMRRPALIELAPRLMQAG
jgi:hypothetical protein